MPTNTQTRILQAQYHPEGYIHATWTTSSVDGVAGYLLQVLWTGGGQGADNFELEDGLSDNVGFPYEFVASKTYSLMVIPYTADEFLSPSAAQPIPNPLRAGTREQSA